MPVAGRHGSPTLHPVEIQTVKIDDKLVQYFYLAIVYFIAGWSSRYDFRFLTYFFLNEFNECTKETLEAMSREVMSLLFYERIA